MNNETKPQEVTAAVLQPEGDLVAAKLPAVRSKLQEMLGAGMVHLTLDLAGTRMVDSAGIGLLISAHNSLKKAGGELTVIHASKEILDLFRTMRIHQHFSVSGGSGNEG
jgi:anti-anti-sigma factor